MHIGVARVSVVTGKDRGTDPCLYKIQRLCHCVDLIGLIALSGLTLQEPAIATIRFQNDGA